MNQLLSSLDGCFHRVLQGYAQLLISHILCFGTCYTYTQSKYTYIYIIFIYIYILYTCFWSKHCGNWDIFGAPWGSYDSLTLLDTNWPQPGVYITDVTKHQKSNSTVYLYIIYIHVYLFYIQICTCIQYIYIELYVHAHMLHFHFLHNAYFSSDIFSGCSVWVWGTGFPRQSLTSQLLFLVEFSIEPRWSFCLG